MARHLHPKWGELAAAALLIALVCAASATAAESWRPSYVDALYEENALEAHGITYNGHPVPIDTAACIGLRRYGVRTSTYGLDRFWRFRCTADAADNHSYDVRTRTQTGARRGWIYTQILSVRRVY